MAMATSRPRRRCARQDRAKRWASAITRSPFALPGKMLTPTGREFAMRRGQVRQRIAIVECCSLPRRLPDGDIWRFRKCRNLSFGDEAVDAALDVFRNFGRRVEIRPQIRLEGW